MQYLLRATCALMLGMALLVSGTAKEWLHDQFAGHEDTAHHTPHRDHELCIEKEHHHCAFLHYHLPACELPLPFHFEAPFRKPEYIRIDSQWLSTSLSVERWLLPGRGPPPGAPSLA